MFVLRSNGRVEFVDLHSLGGSYVNGREVDWAHIGAEDRIKIGPYQLQVISDTIHPPGKPLLPSTVWPKARIRALDAASCGKNEIVLSKAVTTLGRPGLAVAKISQQRRRHWLSLVDGEAPLLNGRTLMVPALLVHLDCVTIGGIRMQYLLGESITQEGNHDSNR